MIDSAVIDLETLGKRPGCIILSAGITVFDSNADQTFDELVTQGIELHFDVAEQMERGLHTDPSTLQWWEKQSEDARAALSDRPKTPIRDLYQALQPLGQVHFFNKLKWYGRGPSFDQSLFEAVLHVFNITPPWKYYNVRCTRTICDEYGISFEHQKTLRPSHMTQHCAQHDSAFDAWLIQHRRTLGK